MKKKVYIKQLTYYLLHGLTCVVPRVRGLHKKQTVYKRYAKMQKYRYSVKPVYNDHLGDEVSAVVIDRWSL